MENESSDDEGYNYKKGTQNFFPWYQRGYKHISDQLDFTQQERVSAIMDEQYPTSEQSDHKIVMKDIENKEAPLPQRIIVISPNSFTVD